MSGELKPCVKCGGSGNLKWSRDGEVEWVRCFKCGRESPLAYSAEEAVRRWNDGEVRTPHVVPSQAAPDFSAFSGVEKMARLMAWHHFGLTWDRMERVSQQEVTAACQAAFDWMNRSLAARQVDLATPSQVLDAATVERCAQVADRLASAEDEALQHAKDEAPADRARIAVIAAEFRRAAKVIRGLATDPHQHGGKGA